MERRQFLDLMRTSQVVTHLRFVDCHAGGHRWRTGVLFGQWPDTSGRGGYIKRYNITGRVARSEAEEAYDRCNLWHTAERLRQDDSDAVDKLANRVEGLAHFSTPEKPKERIWVIDYCHGEYQHIIDKVPSAKQTVVLSGDATIGMIGAIEDTIIAQGCTLINSKPELREIR